jgi:hypothetical protein
MNGIPVRIMREGEPETVYLSCARTGEIGKRLQELKAACRKLARDEFDLAKRVALAMAKADELQKKDAPIVEFENLLNEQRQLTENLANAGEQRLAACEDLWIEALRPNHGADAEAIADCLADVQILKAVAILEQGECPADFFPNPAPPKSASGIAPTGGSASGSSSKKDLPPPNSTPAA